MSNDTVDKLPERRSPPVLFIIFNRPASTRESFAAIRRARPPRLYIAADGPREDNEKDLIMCSACREQVANVDWPCVVNTKFETLNLGCKDAVSGAISWFFQHEEAGIIIEDDCVAHEGFFEYCRMMLETYKNDTRVMAIGGSNLLPERNIYKYSYLFSRHAFIWGWATWRRAWLHYQRDIGHLSRGEIQQVIAQTFERFIVRRYWMRRICAVADGKIDTWDYQWCFAIWRSRGVTCVPATNMVRNIGFGSDATHTKDAQAACANLELKAAEFPLTHPPIVEPDKHFDEQIEDRGYLPPAARIVNRVISSVRRLFC